MISLIDMIKTLSRNTGPVTQDEIDTLQNIADHLNQPMPKYACPHCWSKRLTAKIPEVAIRNPQTRPQIKV